MLGRPKLLVDPDLGGLVRRRGMARRRGDRARRRAGPGARVPAGLGRVEHTLGARIRNGHLIELNGSGLARFDRAMDR